ncbi:Molybdenum transport system permease protein ModB [Dissulfuribacter thermophilus]|uniref:Molybdenum transport system permease n=1 Tax=Dissulfuribacter thermophilus TaxID=1156395 RepID=A0A1B9F4T5_9BACT|nr:molybdate ABC transporter permease subunit [Dissulfuribacter thermophilus]OCC14932.1 Molybdenum transport system permease protein ModB [Dissulfuribacter thermophilus]
MDLTPLYLTAKLALVTTAILLVIAAPIAYCFAYVRLPAKPYLEALVSMPLVLPPTVLGFYLLIIMGPNGVLGHFWERVTGERLCFTFTGIVIASLVYSFPFAVQPLKAAFEKIDRRMLESAYVLGCSRIQTFYKVILPNSLNGILVAAILTFAHTMGEFGVVLMVGGSIPGKTKVASIAIYEYVESLRYSDANMLSLALAVTSYLVLVAVNSLNRRNSHGT